MYYIVFDLEWNQSSKGKRFINPKIPFEIIEIGAVKLNDKLETVGEFHELVKPKVYHNVSRITENIVHIDTKDLESARYFPRVMRSFLDFCGEDYIFCTWGNLDLIELQRNMNYHGIKPLSDRPIAFLDIQKIFALQFEGKKRQQTLEYATDFCHIEKDIDFHRAFADAYYTAKVMEHLKPSFLKQYSFDTFNIPRSKDAEIKIRFPDYDKFISRGYKDKASLLLDKEVSYCGCHLCKCPFTKKIKWFSPNGKHYYCVSKCLKHGFIKGKIRIKKSESGEFYAVKTMKRINTEQMLEIKARFLKSKEHSKSEK